MLQNQCTTTLTDVEQILCANASKNESKSKNVKVPSAIYDEYFKDKDSNVAMKMIEKALVAWLAAEGVADD